MDAFVRVPARNQRLACLLAEEAMRLQAASVEKDFWVCWTLRELFTLANIGGRWAGFWHNTGAVSPSSVDEK